jgi:hypothetical protein
LKRLQLRSRAVTVVGFTHHNTGKEGAKSKGESEQLGRAPTIFNVPKQRATRGTGVIMLPKAAFKRGRQFGAHAILP